MGGGIVGSGLPPGDEQWVIVDGRQLVVSRSFGTKAPGAWISVHTNAVPGEPISGEFGFDIALHATDSAGKPVRLLEQVKTAMAIPTAATHIFQSHLPDDAPANYRLAVTVRGQGVDRELSSYLAVPEQRVEASIAPVRAAVRAGERVLFTLTNTGPTSLLHGVSYRLERSTRDGWQNCNVEEAFDLSGLGLEPGSQAECEAQIPRNAPAGRYLVTKDVSGGGTHIRRTLSFEFDVVA